MTGNVVIALIRGYQTWLSPMKIFFGATGGTCRFTPTCSEYAIQAVQQRGVLPGLILGLGRILRCQPWGGHGYDPVPAAAGKNRDQILQGKTCGCGSSSKHLEHFHG